MISVEDREKIRRAYFIEKKSLRQIAKELRVARKTVRKAIASAEPETYTLSEPRSAPILGPYKDRIDALLAANEKLPIKQRYTGHLIFKELTQVGYQGSESTVRHYVAQRRREKRRPKVYIPLEFDPGTDAQVDWGEAVAEPVLTRSSQQRLCPQLSGFPDAEADRPARRDTVRPSWPGRSESMTQSRWPSRLKRRRSNSTFTVNHGNETVWFAGSHHREAWSWRHRPYSRVTMHMDEKDGKAVLVCTVGSTVLLYDARCTKPHTTLKAAGDWRNLAAPMSRSR